MRKTLLTLATALAATLAPGNAGAACDECGVAAGVAKGLAAGAIMNSVLTNPPQEPQVESSVEVSTPTSGTFKSVCHVESQRVHVPGQGWRERRVEVCN